MEKSLFGGESLDCMAGLPSVWCFLALQLEDVVLEAVISCSHKTVHYAVLLGERYRDLVAPSFAAAFMYELWS
jgi:hypothetical protein